MKRFAKLTAWLLILFASVARGDTAAEIQAKINTLVAEHGGGIVRLDPGRHPLEFGLLLPAKVELTGAGRATSLEPAAGFVAVTFAGDHAALRDCLILNKPGGVGVEINGKKHCDIANVDMHQGAYGVRNTGGGTSQGVTMSRCLIQSQSVAAVSLESSTNDFRIHYGRLHNCPAGFRIVAGNGCTLLGVTLSRNVLAFDAAAAVDKGVKGIMAFGLRFEKNDIDLSLNSRTYNCHFVAAYAADNNGQVIRLDAGTGNKFDFTP